jgi:YbgC/YbaW family acyl-CoA thioester hydrolase
VGELAGHREEFRVGWIDTDASGRIHHTAPFRWAEATEIALVRKLGLLNGGHGRWPRRHVEAEYPLALAFEDVVEVVLEVASVGRSSVTFEWRVLRAGEVAVEGRHTAVQVDDDGQPLALADEVREALLSGRAVVRPASRSG